MMDTKTCTKCNGRGELQDMRDLPYLEGGMEEYVSKIKPNFFNSIDPSRPLGEIETCSNCKGFGVTSARMMQAYKNRKMADRYRGTKAARKCHYCAGIEKTQEVPVWVECHDCDGSGKQPIWDLSGDRIVPECFDIYGYMDKEYRAHIASQLEIIVNRQDQGVSWVEANIGGGGAWSSVDYGDAWKKSDDEVIEMVRGKLANDMSQVVKWVNKETRVFTTRVLIRLRQNGYTVFPLIDGDIQELPMSSLPPTYAGLDKVQW